MSGKISADAKAGKAKSRPLRPKAMQIWDGERAREEIAKDQPTTAVIPGGKRHERSSQAGAQRGAWRQQRAVPEPTRVRAQGPRQSQPERLGLHRRRGRDR